jgi:hypothetical protein
MQINRVLQWIHYDRKEYWAERVRRGYQEVADAKQNLERRLIYRASNERPSCREEKAALEKAKRRLEVAQEKVQAVRHWAHSIEHEIREFRGSISPLAGWVQADLPRACALLQRMSLALDAYVNQAAPEEEPGVDWMAMIAEASACVVAGTAAEESATPGHEDAAVEALAPAATPGHEDAAVEGLTPAATPGRGDAAVEGLTPAATPAEEEKKEVSHEGLRPDVGVGETRPGDASPGSEEGRSDGPVG